MYIIQLLYNFPHAVFILTVFFFKSDFEIQQKGPFNDRQTIFLSPQLQRAHAVISDGINLDSIILGSPSGGSNAVLPTCSSCKRGRSILMNGPFVSDYIKLTLATTNCHPPPWLPPKHTRTQSEKLMWLITCSLSLPPYNYHLYFFLIAFISSHLRIIALFSLIYSFFIASSSIIPEVSLIHHSYKLCNRVNDYQVFAQIIVLHLCTFGIWSLN